MFDMNFEPWIVGDISTVGFMEELQEQAVNDALDYIHSHYSNSLPLAAMQAVIGEFDIDYPNLPDWLRAKLDTVDVY